VSAFIPIGPLGQGGAAIIQLGVVARDIEFISPQFSQTLYGIGLFCGLLMWSYALFWITQAIVTMAAKFPHIPFSVAWWGFIFPLGMSPQISGCPCGRLLFDSLFHYAPASHKNSLQFFLISRHFCFVFRTTRKGIASSLL
jgi:Voltage-dependent anion channel